MDIESSRSPLRAMNGSSVAPSSSCATTNSSFTASEASRVTQGKELSPHGKSGVEGSEKLWWNIDEIENIIGLGRFQ
ncbi:hypothetical protein Naga_100320g1 [Nannochloropsis gaditana]|uniref:Uncharacterized protein n=1 Tax=Nannochloropsis gaditana TaxID=72520 RepID=W7TH79_9STRA|nr:hypothetical protein Naga_100320g1 [Nannochloropsis gaditana]